VSEEEDVWLSCMDCNRMIRGVLHLQESWEPQGSGDSPSGEHRCTSKEWALVFPSDDVR